MFAGGFYAERLVDDYITKPFSLPILIRKIAAVLRRSNHIQNEESQRIFYKNLALDLESYAVAVDGESFELTQREFEVLRELLIHQGRVLTRRNLLDKLWKYDFYGDERVVDTHIKNLREKLGVGFIQTIRGDIKLRKKIGNSLFAKVFIITALFLSGIAFVVLGLLAWLLPKTYSNRLNAVLDGKTQEFVSELEQVAWKDSGGLFDQFLQNEDIYTVELYKDDGSMVSLPTNQFLDDGNVTLRYQQKAA